MIWSETLLIKNPVLFRKAKTRAAYKAFCNLKAPTKRNLDWVSIMDWKVQPITMDKKCPQINIVPRKEVD